MVTTKLLGGLGNQMFQYAFGRQLALKNKTSLYLDTSALNFRSLDINYTIRNFELKVFNISSKNDDKQIFNLKKKIYDKIIPVKKIVETDFHFNKNLLDAKGNIYLDGYWQNENYFKDCEETIRKDFTFKAEPIGVNATYLKDILNANAISIHFRRGDYLTNQSANDFHGICSLEYYYSAVAYIKQMYSEASFYIFSDDVKWVKDNFNLSGNVTFINNNTGNASHEDLRLMAACKHNIIANSSFSWWGAWLNINKGKVVIAPKTWFAKRETDIVCKNWIKL